MIATEVLERAQAELLDWQRSDWSDELLGWAGVDRALLGRVVPGGTTVRRGAYLGSGVVVMPPAYINVGAWVGERSMIDSHALVGSCAQIGARVHLSAAAQVGGVLEPVGALPVIVEDDVFVSCSHARCPCSTSPEARSTELPGTGPWRFRRERWSFRGRGGCPEPWPKLTGFSTTPR